MEIAVPITVMPRLTSSAVRTPSGTQYSTVPYVDQHPDRRPGHRPALGT
ncbi:hypothetical protein ACFYOD_02815 [Streptomyces sp. NPDC006703]